MKNIYSSQTHTEEESKKLGRVKKSLARPITDRAREALPRPDESAFAEILKKTEITVKHVKGPKTVPEKNLEIFEERIRRNIPMLEPFPSKATDENVFDAQLRTWTKALDDRLWTRKVNAVI